MRKQYNPGISNLIKKAFAIACLDGGAIIAIQIANFLLVYFTIKNHFLTDINGFSLDKIATVLFSILNASAITVRITGLNFGLKYPLANCYQHALRRLPATISLCCIGALFFLFIVTPLMIFIMNTGMSRIGLLLSCAAYPFIQTTFNYVLMEETNAIDAIAATIRLFVNRINWRITLHLVCLYCIPLTIANLLSISVLQSSPQYIQLASQVWMLFCDIVTITIFAENIQRKVKKTNTKIKTFVA